MIYKMTLKDSADEMTFDLLEVPIVDKDIEGAVDNVTLDGNQYTDYLWLKKQFVQKWSILCDDEYTRLRGFYTRQFENADVPSYRLYYGDDIVRNSTLSGEYIQFSVEGVADGTISLTQIDGNAEQMNYSGKNLVNINATTTNIYATTSVSGQTITVTSDSSANVARVYLPLTYEANRQMTLSFDARVIENSTASGLISQVCLRTPDGSDTLGNTRISTTVGQTNHYHVTVTADNNTRWLWLYTKATGVAGVVKVEYSNIQLEYSASETSYEPYVGGIPAPNPSYPQPISTVTGEQTVAIIGKNLLSIPTGTHSSSAVTWEITDDTISASGTATSTWSELLARQNFAIPLSAGTYTFSIPRALPQRIQLVLYEANNTMHDFNIYEGSTYVEAITTYTVVACRIVYRANSSAVSLSFPNKLMIEQSATPTTFSPYQGRIYKINLGGTNLLPSTGMTPTGGTGVSFTKNDDGTYIINGTASSGGFLEIGTIDFKQGQTYTISGLTGWTALTLQLFTTSNTAFPVGHRLASYNGATTQTALGNETCDVRLYVYQGVTYNNVVVKPMVQLGSQATPYAPYTTYAYELAKIGTYQDRIYKNEGKWYIEKQVGKVVLDGTEAGWSWADTARYTITTSNIGARVGMSDNFTYANYTGHATTASPSFDIGSNLASIGFHDKDITSLNNFKTWLASNPTTVYYPLATPTTTEITNEALVEQLEALVDEAISVGQHNIYTDTPNALPTLTFDLTEYLSKSTTIIPETAVRLTLTDGGVINACGCRKDVQLTMRETIE